jgi:putative ABC transport system substrate-binding protein
MRRIGVLMAHAGSDRESQAFVVAFREGLQNLGWTDCQIIVEEQQCRLQP